VEPDLELDQKPEPGLKAELQPELEPALEPGARAAPEAGTGAKTGAATGAGNAAGAGLKPVLALMPGDTTTDRAGSWGLN
jgi:hypothetical protein